MDTMIAVEQPKKRKVSRATGRPGDEATGRRKTKVGLVLSDEAARLLAVQAIMTNQDRSEIVNALLMEHCRGWVVSRRGPVAPSPSTQEVSAG